MPICSLMKEGLGLDLTRWGGGEDLGRTEGETVIKIYCMKEIYPTKRKGNWVIKFTEHASMPGHSFTFPIFSIIDDHTLSSPRKPRMLEVSTLSCSVLIAESKPTTAEKKSTKRCLLLQWLSNHAGIPTVGGRHSALLLEQCPGGLPPLLTFW